MLFRVQAVRFGLYALGVQDAGVWEFWVLG